MEKLFTTLALLGIFALPACAREPLGFVYQNTNQTLLGSSNIAPSKVGTATCHQYFGVVAIGNCSIKKAMANGRINNLAFVDQKIFNILGWAKIETKAYGQ